MELKVTFKNKLSNRITKKISKNKSNKTKLLNAIENSDLNTIQDVAKNTRGICLRESVKNGRLDLVEMLINQGYKINKTEKLAVSRWIAKKGQLEILLFLVEKGIINANNPRMLVESACNGQVEIIKFLVNQGTDINVCKESLLEVRDWVINLETVLEVKVGNLL